MCGIAGIIVKQSIEPVHERSLERMLQSMVHRGPDGKGAFRDRSIAIGMRRLSIIDLKGGWQPLFNENKNLAVIANGEIYNYLELTKALEERGHVFSSHSDCETILHLYEEYGEQCVHHLRGMFAFALYDKLNRKVIIARDRMGEKPLYFFRSNTEFIFSSELKSILSTDLVPFDLDPVSINNYFHYQYVPEPKTPLRDVQKLPAGNLLAIDLDRWRFDMKRYWHFEDAAPVQGDPAALIAEELDTISKLIIRSDVPVGVALSGGLDSSAIAALAVKKYPGVMHAFSVGYPGRAANDERNDAKLLADHLRMPMHEIELTTDDCVSLFEEMNYMRDDPIADISGYGYYAVSKEARRFGVPVLLQGQGGDELFWGYAWVVDAIKMTEKSIHGSAMYHNLREHLKQFPGIRLDNIRTQIKWIRSLLPVFNKIRTNVRIGPSRYRPILFELTPDFQIACATLNQYFTPGFREKLNATSASDVYTFTSQWPFTDIRMTRLICDTYLLENGIAQGDRLSMANSVELRLPFVDYKLVELVIGLRKAHQDRPDYKDFPKPWLRAALKGILPEWVLNRPKQGFAPPVLEWHTKIFEKYGHYLINGNLVGSGILSEEAGRILSTGPFPPGAVTPISFKALVLETWYRNIKKHRVQM